MYFVQRNSTHDWFGITQIFKGTDGGAVTVATDGKLSKGGSTYNPTIVLLRFGF